MELEYLKYALGTHLFVKVPRPGDSELKRRVLFGFRSKLFTSYYQSMSLSIY